MWVPYEDKSNGRSYSPVLEELLIEQYQEIQKSTIWWYFSYSFHATMGKNYVPCPSVMF